MKSAIFVVDDFPESKSDKIHWYDLGRDKIHSYAKKFDIPIVNTTKESKSFKQFYKLFSKFESESCKTVIPYAMKMMRHYEFINSDYDYAFFVDLDFLVTNTELNINELVDPNLIYINAYNHTRDRAIKKHSFQNKTSARFKIFKKASPNSDDDKLINFSTGFYGCGKQQAIDIVKYFDQLGINPILESGIKKLSDIDFPGCLDEALIGVACNFSGVKFDYANIAKLCDEDFIYYEDCPSVFFHVVGGDRWWTKDRAYQMLNHFTEYYGNRNG